MELARSPVNDWFGDGDEITEAQISMLKTPAVSVLYRRVDFSVFCNPGQQLCARFASFASFASPSLLPPASIASEVPFILN